MMQHIINASALTIRVWFPSTESLVIDGIQEDFALSHCTQFRAHVNPQEATKVQFSPQSLLVVALTNDPHDKYFITIIMSVLHFVQDLGRSANAFSSVAPAHCDEDEVKSVQVTIQCVSDL